MADGGTIETTRTRKVVDARTPRVEARDPAAEARRLLEVMEISPNLVGTVDAAGRITYLNRAGHALLGLPWSDDPDRSIIEVGIETLHPPEMQELYWGEIVPAVKRDGIWEGDTEVIDRLGKRIPVSQLVVAHRAEPGADGEPGPITHLSTIVRDMRERVALEERLRAARLASERARDAAEMALAHAQNTTHEVNHRVKNLFALVPAIVQMSARSTNDVRKLVTMVRDRLAALSRSHELTLNENGELTGIELRRLLQTVLEPYVGASEPAVLDGPELRMNASDGNALSLMLHELATNAAKHGALSHAAGRLTVTWQLGTRDALGAPPAADDDSRWTVLHLRWHETSSGPLPKPVRAPARSGSGTYLLDRLVQAQRGLIKRGWHKRGLDFSIALPIHGARPANRPR